MIAQYRNVDGLLVPIAPEPVTGPPDAGERWVGLGLQIGLTDAEIQGVRDRREALLAKIDKREIGTF